MNYQILAIYWSFAGLFMAIYSYIRMKTMKPDKREEYERLIKMLSEILDLSVEGTEWLVICIELIFGGITFPFMIINRIHKLLTGKDIVEHEER